VGTEFNFRDGLAYDDILIVPQHSHVLPHETDLASCLTRSIKLKTPLVSAAMDTVTESATAIAMAQAGGIGVIHKNLSIDDQAREVRKVKKSESGMVTDPIWVKPNDTVGDVIGIMQKYRFSGFPVVDNDQLVGIVTGRDIRFETINNLPLGRSVDEMIRLLEALQHTEQHGEVCPANWKKGETAMKANQDGLKTFFKK
jgi:IMP dehydrogenase